MPVCLLCLCIHTFHATLQYASDALLKSRNFGTRAFTDGKKRFVVPIEEIESAFWLSAPGLDMKV